MTLYPVCSTQPFPEGQSRLSSSYNLSFRSIPSNIFKHTYQNPRFLFPRIQSISHCLPGIMDPLSVFLPLTLDVTRPPRLSLQRLYTWNSLPLPLLSVPTEIRRAGPALRYVTQVPRTMSLQCRVEQDEVQSGISPGIAHSRNKYLRSVHYVPGTALPT